MTRPGSGLALSVGSAQALSLLDRAADLLAVQRDFAAAVETCEQGISCVDSSNDNEENYRCSEVKVCLCVIGIQALAELNRWQEVLSWVLRYFQVPAKMPAKIIQLCILLHSKVEEPQAMLAVGREWLTDLANQSLPTYSTVAELHLLHILLPLGLFAEAEDLAKNPASFCAEQRRVALEVVRQRKERHVELEEPKTLTALNRQQSDRSTVRQEDSETGFRSQKLLAMIRLFQRALVLIRSRLRSFHLQRMILATFLLYLVVIRLDPASPSTLPWISKLLRIFRHLWNSMFAPYYKAKIND
ncbi:peroxisome assembly protein 26 isoform X1 [Latimeria chalumnae]|uniref:Peroxisomal biosis factor 26 n=2 Tax=Latimeria chalumnae TaxID=7897 RepID=H3BFC9_LATCH|nr:PREDICTED: peroxisome assembly protein 26 isoform X1 [Latimeria chalumnae]XP_014353406.1 PREDICTED: peroxisome assembly protein 26 isoform X1 [Latimeria chalumnae]|eukprot:XP_005988709.1 PREDICTED: peroxisome assembly protein 26 isoform X1 [Latimeria chalumnae]